MPSCRTKGRKDTAQGPAGAENFAAFSLHSTIAAMETIAFRSAADRRLNKLFVTRNTEYYLRDGLCLAVKDRRTNEWLDGHLAIGRQLSGGVRILANGEAIPVPSLPQVGEALYFAEGGRELITSVLCSVERAPQQLVHDFAN